MNESRITPEKIKKPFQLLAAWLVGMTVVVTAFLTGARLIQNPAWAPGALVIAAIASVPVFLLCLFLLQTRFRPELQEDEFYSEYLARTSESTALELEIARRTEAALDEVRVSSKKELNLLISRFETERETRKTTNHLEAELDTVNTQVDDIVQRTISASRDAELKAKTEAFQKTVLTYIADHPGESLDTIEISNILGVPVFYTHNQLRRMREQGLIPQPSRRRKPSFKGFPAHIFYSSRPRLFFETKNEEPAEDESSDETNSPATDD